MTDERLSKTYWERRKAAEDAWVTEVTGMTAAEVEADLGAPDHYVEEEV